MNILLPVLLGVFLACIFNFIKGMKAKAAQEAQEKKEALEEKKIKSIVDSVVNSTSREVNEILDNDED